jgi:hypothetical protein
MENGPKTFPLLTNEKWLEDLEKAVKMSPEKSKRDFIFKAVAEKIERTKQARK